MPLTRTGQFGYEDNEETFGNKKGSHDEFIAPHEIMKSVSLFPNGPQNQLNSGYNSDSNRYQDVPAQSPSGLGQK